MDILGHLRKRGCLPKIKNAEVEFIGSLLRFLSGEGEILHLPRAGGLDDQPWDLMGWIYRTQDSIKGYFSDKVKKGRKSGQN